MEVFMVRIDDSQIEEIQYIINQSMNGLHVLFDNETIKKYLRGKDNEDDIFDENTSKRTELLLEKFMSIPSIRAKKMFFKDLQEDDKSLLIRTYFNIVENNVLSSNRKAN
jgi:hypothetical protein